MKPPLTHFLFSVIIILAGIAIFHSCRKEENCAMVETTAIKHIFSTTARVYGRITAMGDGVEQYGHCWDTIVNPTINSSKTVLGPASSTRVYSNVIEGLKANSIYHFRAYVKSGSEVVYGKDMTFTTMDGKASLVTSEITNIRFNSASSGGKISSVNGDRVISRGVCWDTLETVNLIINAGYTNNGPGADRFTSEITGLTSERTYYVKAYAVSSVDTSYAAALSFATLDGRPMLTTSEVTSIDIINGTAASGGNIFSGVMPVTDRGVCWSTSMDPTIADNMTNDGGGTGSFTSILSGLAGGTYYVRAYAKNSIGVGYGDSRIFNFTDFVEVTNPVTGRTWMDRNLGARRAATSSTDTEAYGDLYQWGRGSDGHQIRTSGTTFWTSDSDTPHHALYITTNYSPNDWRKPQNDKLWQGANGINNPCPKEYRLPSDAEWKAERNSWSSIDDAGAFNSPLKLPLAGRRINGSGEGSSGLWTGITDGTGARYFNLKGSFNSSPRSNGYTVRCIKSQGNGLPEIIIDTITYTDTTVNVRGYVVSDGGYQVTARGVCWSTSPNPTTADNVTNDGNGTGSFTRVLSGLSPSFTYYLRAYATNSLGTIYGEQRSFIPFTMTSPVTGRTWMMYDLAGYYQWGRGNDGHQNQKSGTTNTLSSSDTPGHGLFIIPPKGSDPYDWRIPQNDNLWQGVNGINNPCPAGFRVPTKVEWEAEIIRSSYGSWTRLGLKNYCTRYPRADLPLDCGRGYLWSTTVDGTSAWAIHHDPYYTNTTIVPRAYGIAVRCIKD